MSWDLQDEDQGQWQQQVNEELEYTICAALDHFQQKGASPDELRLIAWQCGVRWQPNVDPRTA